MVNTAINKGQDLGLAEQRLGTMIHELTHALIEQFACSDCGTYKENAASHGRAWQLLSRAIEKVASKLLLSEIGSRRFKGLMGDIELGFRVPSAHDVEIHDFGAGGEQVDGADG
ncbi:hypothetical protein P154DRAFT_529616 [Amniculicola lignicola CBS 123094]|uniref:SprT-like domain-containing protein n=1 Tax=Amniculicola lignicola CBS 123094 TaxID=1392246 RepID=A0A6A5X261_9PLEO|nr:hypothetical protein P154DRAFT_529616 [Amniculicola lignicola CBS 123094]